MWDFDATRNESGWRSVRISDEKAKQLVGNKSELRKLDRNRNGDPVGNKRLGLIDTEAHLFRNKKGYGICGSTSAIAETLKKLRRGETGFMQFQTSLKIARQRRELEYRPPRPFRPPL